METWSSRTGFILAAVGSAVGIGNIWRFSAVVGENGGGAYLLPYLLAVAAFGIPLMVLEFAVGRRLRTNMVGAFRSASARLEPVGWLVATVVFTILSYYLVITGWTLLFSGAYALGGSIRFEDITGGLAPVWAFLATGVATGAIVSLGVRRGIERMATVLMPLSLLILLALLGYSVTLEGFGEGVRYLFTPDFSVLSDVRVLSAAFGQAFFSLSVGFGVLLTYGSYLDRRADIVRSSITIAGADLSVALVAGLVIFAAVFTFGLEPAVGAELAFTTLPAAFEQMPGGMLLAPAFFVLLFFAALTSAVSMLEVSVAAVSERAALTRRQATVILTGLVMVLGLPSALSYSSVDLRVLGWRVFDALDASVGTMGLPITALLIAVVFSRVIPRAALEEELGAADGGWRRVILPLVRYAIPAVLLLITVSRLVLDFDPAGWHWLPGVPYLGSARQAIVTLVLLAGLLASTLAVVTVLRRRRALS